MFCPRSVDSKPLELGWQSSSVSRADCPGPNISSNSLIYNKWSHIKVILTQTISEAEWLWSLTMSKVRQNHFTLVCDKLLFPISRKKALCVPWTHVILAECRILAANYAQFGWSSFGLPSWRETSAPGLPCCYCPCAGLRDVGHHVRLPFGFSGGGCVCMYIYLF